MARQQLSGSLDEQLAAVYDMVLERMADGRYSGAVHYARAIIKVDPNFRDIQAVLQRAQAARREQNLTLIISLISAMAAVAITRIMGLTADWQSLLVAFIGLVIGFFFSSWLFRRRSAD